MGYSSGIIKPDGIKRNLQVDIFNWMESIGLHVILQKKIELSKEDVKVVYKYCYEMSHYIALESFMISGPVIFYVVFYNGDGVEQLNRLVGSTDPAKSAPDTIRGKYGTSIANNVIHSTQNNNTFRSEIECFLTKRELVDIILSSN